MEHTQYTMAVYDGVQSLHLVLQEVTVDCPHVTRQCGQ